MRVSVLDPYMVRPSTVSGVVFTLGNERAVRMSSLRLSRRASRTFWPPVAAVCRSSSSAALLRYTMSPASSATSRTAGALSSTARSASADRTAAGTPSAAPRRHHLVISVPPCAVPESDHRRPCRQPEDLESPAGRRSTGTRRHRRAAAGLGVPAFPTYYPPVADVRLD